MAKAIKEKDYDFVEIDKPSTLKDATQDLYYMLSNSHDKSGTTYMQITTQLELDVAYKVYAIKQE